MLLKSIFSLIDPVITTILAFRPLPTSETIFLSIYILIIRRTRSLYIGKVLYYATT